MRSLLLQVLLLVFFIPYLIGATYTVTNTLNYGEGSFRVALEMSNTSAAADTIIIAPELEGEIIYANLNGAINYMFTISSPLVLYGNGIIFYSLESGAFFQLATSQAEIHDVTIQNVGTSLVGLAAITIAPVGGTYLVRGCTFRDNFSFAPFNQGRGVAIWQHSGNLTIENCHFQNNNGTLSVGAAIYAGGFVEMGQPNHQLEVSNCTFVNNRGSDPILIGCGVDYVLRDPSGEAGLRNGCPSASVSLAPGLVVPSGVSLSIPMITF